MVECTDEEDKVWIVYDAGPKTVRCPLVFLPPASGTADVFFKQILALSSLGYRVMSVSEKFLMIVYEHIFYLPLFPSYMLCCLTILVTRFSEYLEKLGFNGVPLIY